MFIVSGSFDEDAYIENQTRSDFIVYSPGIQACLLYTSLEYRLLKILTKNPQNVLTRQVLLEKLWDADGNLSLIHI